MRSDVSEDAIHAVSDTLADLARTTRRVIVHQQAPDAAESPCCDGTSHVTTWWN